MQAMFTRRGFLALSCTLAVLPLFASACGGKNIVSTEEPSDASAASDGNVGWDAPATQGDAPRATDAASACDAQLPPYWRPPTGHPTRPFTPGICTEAQIRDAQSLCDDGASTYDPAACNAFKLAPANAACLGCIFSTADEFSYGAIVIEPDGTWEPNAAGCIAAIDGYAYVAGCGAKLLASRLCRTAACDHCSVDTPAEHAAWSHCWNDSADAPCQVYQDAAMCAEAPQYAACGMGEPTFAQYFFDIASFFCGPTHDAGARMDAMACGTEPPSAKPAGDDLDLIEGTGPATSWWVVNYVSPNDMQPAPPVFVPPKSPPLPTTTTADGRTFLQMKGTGLTPLDMGGLVLTLRPGTNGGGPVDLADGIGISFDAKGTNLWVQIDTIDTEPGFCRCAPSDCYGGYRVQVPVTADWAHYTVLWSELVQPSWVAKRVPLDAHNVVVVGFDGFSGDFDFAVDNVRLWRADEGSDAAVIDAAVIDAAVRAMPP
jgi:hypothetical protein